MTDSSVGSTEKAPVTVFLLDDHEVVRRGVHDLLDAEPDLTVIGEAGTAEQALVRVPALRPQVAVLDVRLPDGDGVSVCRELRSRMPDLACLMLTSFDDEEALLDAIMAGASGYVLKQITGTDLVNAVRTVASGQSMLDPGATARVMARLRGGPVQQEEPQGLAVLTDREREILVLVAFSFNASKFSAEWRGFTIQWYHRLLERADVIHGLELSLVVATVSTVISAALGTLVALALARHRFRGRPAVEAFLYVPVVTPEIVVGISLLLLFALLGLPLGVATIVIAHVAFSLSFVVIVVRARLAGMDTSLEEAALILGADEITAFRRVTLPQLWPGVMAGALLAFILSFDDFLITSFVAGSGTSTLPLVVYGMARRNVEPSINAISTIILVVTTAVLYLAERVTRER